MNWIKLNPYWLVRWDRIATWPKLLVTLNDDGISGESLLKIQLFFNFSIISILNCFVERVYNEVVYASYIYHKALTFYMWENYTDDMDESLTKFNWLNLLNSNMVWNWGFSLFDFEGIIILYFNRRWKNIVHVLWT